MMVKTEEFITNRLLWKAAQFNLPTHLSFFFKNLTLALQQQLLQSIDTTFSGQPVLYFTKPTNEWTLVCTKQVIGYDKSAIIQINLADIKQINSADFDTTPGPVDIKTVKKKTEWDRLKIEAENGTYILHSGPGKDFFALWNILLMLIRMEGI